MIRAEAGKGVSSIVETEVYGMVPAMALLDSAAHYLQIVDFDSKQVVELAMLDMLGGT